MPPNSDEPAPYSTLRQFGAKERAEPYDRFLVKFRRSRLAAQVIIIPQGRVQMSVHTHADALAVDFRRHQVVDPNCAETYRVRPGYHLHDELRQLKELGRPAILINGNNIGYWGNQYVIQKHELRYKRSGPIFDDGDLLRHAHAGHHSFFVAGDTGFRIERLGLAGTRKAESPTLEELVVSDGELPSVGLSGFPLLRNGRPVWHEYGPLAWDPGLLFDLGRIPRDWTVIELRDHVTELLESKAELTRHPMTVVGIDRYDQVVLMVVERSADSRGMTVAEAADLLRRRFGVQEAVVLGAAGDAQLATTEEGFLTEPLVAPYARPSARQIPDELLHERLRGRPVWARPVPCYVQFDLVASDLARHGRRSPEPMGMA